MSKTQRWEWAISLSLEELSDNHLQQAYKLNWDNLCKFDSCRKNCKRVLCLACFDRSWVGNSNDYNFETTNCEQKRADLKSFVGLKNLGATCYVNCLLQLWFHNPALRKAIYEYKSDSETPKALPEPPVIEAEVTSKIDKTPTACPPQTKSQPNPIEQLQLIFARMQFTNKKSIDPFNFIDSLALNAAEQQDAQEFGNLFMELLEKSFANQKSTFVSKIIPNQFRGRYSYATICDQCKHSSLRDSTFYELDLTIQNLENLHDCLDVYFRSVPLDGPYNCSHCQRAQSAHRKTILKSLPPTLNLQLLRFVYDKERCTRQKLNSYIIFPEILDMNSYLKDSNGKSRGTSQDNMFLNSRNQPRAQSNIYILSAVLIHRGSSPHSGHYIAHIKDRTTKEWWKFNDDSVERIGPQLQVSSDGESITIVDDKTEIIKTSPTNGGKIAKLESRSLKSKTAYMLVYQAQDNETLSYPSDHSEEWVLPDHLQLAVAEENSRSEEVFESLQLAKEVDLQAMEARKFQVRTTYEKLICRDPSDKFEFIDKNWIQNWLTNSSATVKFPEIDNSHLLCYHSKLDFRKMDQVRCIRSEGADLLYKEYGGGPRLVDAMCRDCVVLEVKLIQLKEKLKEHQKFITSQSKFKLEVGYDFDDAYIVGKKSYRDWQALVMCQFEKSNPELLSRKKDGKRGNHASSDEDDNKPEVIAVKGSHNIEDRSESESDDEALERFVFNSDILCEHNQLIHEPSAWRIVPKEVWMIFKSYFGNDPDRPIFEYNANTIMCAECKRQEDKQQEIGDQQKSIAQAQKSKLLDLFYNRKRASWSNIEPVDEYYALDRQFLVRWQKFLRNPSNQEQPDAVRNKERIICEHGKSLYNQTNSNPILPDSPFVLISREELENLRSFYEVDQTIKFKVDASLADEKLKFHVANHKALSVKRASGHDGLNNTRSDSLGDHAHRQNSQVVPEIVDLTISDQSDQNVDMSNLDEELDLSEIDWSECIVSEPDFCLECHEILKRDELKKLLNYESATIYITKVENVPAHGIQNQTSNGSTSNNTDNCDTDLKEIIKRRLDNNVPSSCGDDNDDQPFKRRRKIYLEDEANDFVPPGTTKQVSVPSPASSSSSMLRRTTRRNRNREQAYTIKPTQTLLQLKKEIFSRCQVLPVDQRLFLNDILLDDNSKTMSELRIVPNCSLKLEVDKPANDNIDLIEDEASSRKSCKYLSTFDQDVRIRKIRSCEMSFKLEDGGHLKGWTQISIRRLIDIPIGSCVNPNL